jgi:divalent metal cation (Fe/Co/Zn/Cd) transporter
VTALTGAGLAPFRKSVLQRRVRLVVSAVIAYNVVEAAVAILAGRAASSLALVSFGLDSCVEVLSAAAIAWQFAGRDPEARETVALRTVAVAFFAVAGYVTVTSLLALSGWESAGESRVGIILAVASLIVMPVLSWIERRTGRELGSVSVVADSKQTLLCTYLSAVLLVGLVLNALLGWSWADPVAALVIAGFAVREGVEAWRGESCCAPPTALLTSDAATATEAAAAEAGCIDDCCRPALQQADQPNARPEAVLEPGEER